MRLVRWPEADAGRFYRLLLFKERRRMTRDESTQRSDGSDKLILVNGMTSPKIQNIV